MHLFVCLCFISIRSLVCIVSIVSPTAAAAWLKLSDFTSDEVTLGKQIWQLACCTKTWQSEKKHKWMSNKHKLFVSVSVYRQNLHLFEVVTSESILSPFLLMLPLLQTRIYLVTWRLTQQKKYINICINIHVVILVFYTKFKAVLYFPVVFNLLIIFVLPLYYNTWNTVDI